VSERRASERGPIEIGLEGVGFDETLVYFARRCCRRAEQALGRPATWRVEITSPPDRQDVEAGVQVWLDAQRYHVASARELDPVLAVRNAFAILGERVENAAPPAMVITPPAPKLAPA